MNEPRCWTTGRHHEFVLRPAVPDVEAPTGRAPQPPFSHDTDFRDATLLLRSTRPARLYEVDFHSLGFVFTL
jgi:hypothetical protein